MGKITDLRPNKGHGRRVSVFLDGRFAFSVGDDVASREDLQPEQTLTAERIGTLVESDRHERCMSAATRYLASRPRSHAELRERLRRRGFDSDTQEAVIARLKEQGLLDDANFARFWTDNRESFSPRSRRLTRMELQKKGVPRDIIDQAVNVIDDQARAYRAALSRVYSLRHSDREEFRCRLGAYLQRRGFGYDVVVRTVEELWKDKESADESSGTG